MANYYHKGPVLPLTGGCRLPLARKAHSPCTESTVTRDVYRNVSEWSVETVPKDKNPVTRDKYSDVGRGHPHARPVQCKNSSFICSTKHCNGVRHACSTGCAHAWAILELDVVNK